MRKNSDNRILSRWILGFVIVLLLVLWLAPKLDAQSPLPFTWRMTDIEREGSRYAVHVDRGAYWIQGR